MAATMRKPLMRIPYTDVFASPRIVPATATGLPQAVDALLEFVNAPPAGGHGHPAPTTVCLLSGAGLSVASGLADYRGDKGTYRLNKTFRPIYYHEFLASHAARRRYWARSFLGWTTMRKAKPNAAHRAVSDLAGMGAVSSVITQNVDGLHSVAGGHVGGGRMGAAGLDGTKRVASLVELHGYLRALVCTACRSEYPRDAFQDDLARLNPAWAAFLAEAVASGGLNTEDPAERNAKGIRSNPDGDVDLPDAPYTTFRYPACPKCLANPPPSVPTDPSSPPMKVESDGDGAWAPTSTAGILKPAVTMFGESISNDVKLAAEQAVTSAGKLMVLGSSLATYSAWRLVKLAKDRGMPVAIVNMGGVRGEDAFFEGLEQAQTGQNGVRIEMPTEVVLPALVEALGRSSPSYSKDVLHGLPPLASTTIASAATVTDGRDGAAAFKDMLS